MGNIGGRVRPAWDLVLSSWVPSARYEPGDSNLKPPRLNACFPTDGIGRFGIAACFAYREAERADEHPDCRRDGGLAIYEGINQAALDGVASRKPAVPTLTL
jgi:hypothetical protein